MTSGPRVYLAGPDVFLPDSHARALELKQICARHGLCGIFPLDVLADEPTAWAELGEARQIALRNEAHIAGCAALIANLTPFRGPSADPGTVFELGFMRALGRPVFGWSNSAHPFTERTRAFLGAAANSGTDGALRDGENMLIEAFGLSDNLMLDGAILSSGGTLVRHEVPLARRWSCLDAFEACVKHAARVMNNSANG